MDSIVTAFLAALISSALSAPFDIDYRQLQYAPDFNSYQTHDYIPTVPKIKTEKQDLVKKTFYETDFPVMTPDRVLVLGLLNTASGSDSINPAVVNALMAFRP